MIVLAVHLDQLRLEIGAGLGEDVAQPVDGIAVEHSAAVLRHKDQVDVHLKMQCRPCLISLSLFIDQKDD